MGTWTRLSSLIAVAVLVVRHSFGKTQGSKSCAPLQVTTDKAQIVSVTIQELCTVFKATDKYVNAQGKLAIEIINCPLAVAPALLFFLKRRGYSRCKAWGGPNGLIISALR
jgi:hypothetical protein